ncbi:MAG: DUF1800 domain-containing protein [Candidatus Sulfotelmatobacter sp.]
MPSRHTQFAASVLCFGLACAVPQMLAKKDMASAPNDPRHALHALNRLTFGPRPGDLQQVMAMGVDRWIDLQLHPDKIDDVALNARLEPLRTLRMSPKEVAEDFPDPQEINEVIKGKKPMPSDPARRAVYQVQLARQEEKKEKKQEADRNEQAAATPMKMAAPPEGSMAAQAAAEAGANDATANPGTGQGDDSMGSASFPAKLSPEEEKQARLREEQLYADLEMQQQIDQLPGLPPDQRFKKILSMQPDAQLAFADKIKGDKAQEYLEGLNPRQKEILIAMNNPGNVITGELTQAKLLRAIYSQRQLEEVMTDFWFNHFNVFVGKGLDRMLLTSYERDVIRPRALGKFEDLLVATAKSPAMLYYLDNYLSVGPDSAQALGLPAHPGPYARRYPRPNPKRKSGLNENYGRELLELHTLSVNGGYSQRDVTEVAKVFTGWTIDKPAEGGGFKFDPGMHEPGPKFVLGHKIKPKGEGEGLELLHRLATSSQTAHFISLKLAERFVADDPSPALVDRMAKTFLKKKGDIREVLETLFHSPEFWDDATYRAKVKTPLEFVASAVRASGADVEDAGPLTNQLRNMGMPLYGAQPPTGYSMKAETWVSSSSLLNRMNFALALTAGKIKGVKVDTTRLAGANFPQPDATAMLSALESSLLTGGVSRQTNDSITAQMEAKNNTPQKADNKAAPHKPDAAGRPPDVNIIAGLLLGSPEFQRR